MRSISQLLVTFLLNASWQIVPIVAATAVSDRLLRGIAARYRHALWVSTLLLALLVPLSITSLTLMTHQPSNQIQPEIEMVPILITSTNPTEAKLSEAGEPEKSTASVKSEPSQGYLMSPITLSQNLASILVAAYGLLFTYGCLRLFHAWLRTRRIVKSAYSPQLSKGIIKALDLCEPILGVRRAQIYCSNSIRLPITVGIFYPLIVLPKSFLHETDDEILTSAIGHELVHVARRDYLANFIYEFINIPLWFHPATRFTLSRIRHTRESCCDQWVTTKLLKPEIYARSLVRLLDKAPPADRPGTVTTIGITETDNLEVRIMSLLRRRSINVRRKVLLIVFSLLLLVTPCAVAAKLALTFDFSAQESTSKRELSDQEGFSLERARVIEDLKKRLEDESLRDLTVLKKALASIENRFGTDEKLMQETKERLSEAGTRYAESLRSQTTADQSDRRARAIYRVHPAYPADAREKGIRGEVELTATVERDGTLQNIQLKKSLYPSLDEASIEAARKMRFAPALEDGQPVPQTIIVGFYFSPESSPAKEQVWGEDPGGVIEARRRKEQISVAQDDRTLRQAELARGAVISMDQAIQIATSRYPGKVLACSLGRDKEGPIFYHLVLINTEGDKHTVTYVWLSAIDGTILKAQDEAEKVGLRGGPIEGDVLNSRAVNLPQPTYPEIARVAHASGTVIVEITVDEEGTVTAARALMGHPLLQGAAVSAARQAKFAPSYLRGQRTTINGKLIYNFVAP